MAHLSKKELQQVRQVMDERYQKLIEEVRDELENSGDQQYVELLGRVPADAGDASVADALADLNAAFVDRQIHELREIEDARRRMEEGSFGECIDCGGDIGFERLMAYPTARRCVRCQETHEKTYASEGRSSL